MSRDIPPDDVSAFIPLLSGLSHDLRGRVAGVSNWLDLYDAARTEEERRRAILRMRSGVDELLLLADDLSDAVRLLEPPAQALAFNVHELIRLALERVGRRVPECRFELVATAADGAWHGKGDAGLVQRAIERMLAIVAVPGNAPRESTIVLGWEGDLLVLRLPAGDAREPAHGSLAERLVSDTSRRGLGLAFVLARETFRGHGGDMILEEKDGERFLVATLSRHPL